MDHTEVGYLNKIRSSLFFPISNVNVSINVNLIRCTIMLIIELRIFFM
jgi:hypothetical protein